MVDLTPEELQIIQDEKDALELVPSTGVIDAAIEQKAAVDAINKKFFDDNNLNIVGYEVEKKNLQGNYPDAPVLEEDIIDASQYLGRIYDPGLGVRDVFRHECFNGTPNLNTSSNETINKDELYVFLNEVRNGCIAPASGLTESAWSGGTGQSDTHLPNGKYLVGKAIVQVTNSVAAGPIFNITYTEIVAGVILSGDTIGNFLGFNNTER